MTEPLSAQDIEHHLLETPAWFSDEENTTIARTFEFRNFEQALEFVNTVGSLAEEAGHHPNIHIHNYKYVTLSLSTHDVGGLTDKDFSLAAKIDAVA